MQNHNKKDMILDAMQELMGSANVQAISVSDIAQKAGIGKGSIYYYFSSKNDIIDAVIERNYSRVLDEGRELAASSHLDAFKKLEIIYHACLDSSMELRRREEIHTFNEQLESAFIHQKFSRIIITKLKPILADIIRQGVREGSIQCSFPEETAQIVLTVLTITLDNHLIPSDDEEIARIRDAGKGHGNPLPHPPVPDAQNMIFISKIRTFPPLLAEKVLIFILFPYPFFPFWLIISMVYRAGNCFQPY